MIGGSKGHPGGKMIPAEAVPAERMRSTNKLPAKTNFFISYLLQFLIQLMKTLLVFNISIFLDVTDKFLFKASASRNLQIPCCIFLRTIAAINSRTSSNSM